MTHKWSLNWDLDVLFAGGSESASFGTYIEQLEQEIAGYRQRLESWTGEELATETVFLDVFTQSQDLASRLEQAMMFVHALLRIDPTDQGATQLQGRMQKAQTELGAARILFEEALVQIPQPQWDALMTLDAVQPVAFPLNDLRQRFLAKLDRAQEILAQDLAVDGFRAWEGFYHKLRSSLKAQVEQNGEQRQLPLGQVMGLFVSHDPAVRAEGRRGMDEAFAQQAELFAHALNHHAGYRLTLTRHRGSGSVMDEAMARNRMSQETLDTMWRVVEANLPRIHPFLQRQAEMLGVEKASWHDLFAPLGQVKNPMDFEQAVDFLIEHFGRISPNLGEMTRKAFAEKWVDAKVRPNSSQGGQCIRFPESKQSRVQYAYRGTVQDLIVLAHELGHAFHNEAMKDLPFMAQDFVMALAETASTFAETIAVEAVKRTATNEEELIPLLASRLQRVVQMVMGVYGAHLFETSLYEERRKGVLSVEQLSTMMENSQKRSYGGALDRYFPFQWAWQPHFYISEIPFYSFTYAFGLLFSTGLYAQALAEGHAFEAKYIALLRDSGRMKVEDLVQNHLGIDLTEPEFWQGALDVIMQDVEKFVQLTEKKVQA